MTTFDVEVRNSDGDYATFATVESALDVDCTDAVVASFDANSGTIADGAACSTDSGGTTGTCVHQSINGQILIIGAAGGTFDDNDVVTDGTNTVTLSTTADDAAIVVTFYDDFTDGTWSGGSYDSVNTLTLTGDTSGWDGKASGGVQVTSGGFCSFKIEDPIFVENFVLQGDSSNDTTFCPRTSSGIVAKNLIIVNGGVRGYQEVGFLCINCVSINSPADGFSTYPTASGSLSCYNCTCVGAADYCYQNGRANNYFAAYNSVGFGSTTGEFDTTDGYLDNGDYLGCSDTSCEVATHYVSELTLANELVDGSNGDVHIKSGSNLIDAGNDYSGTTGINYDIDNVTRSGTWDIGADEYVAASYSGRGIGRGISRGVFR